jgi:hypothetical protein
MFTTKTAVALSKNSWLMLIVPRCHVVFAGSEPQVEDRIDFVQTSVFVASVDRPHFERNAAMFRQIDRTFGTKHAVLENRVNHSHNKLPVWPPRASGDDIINVIIQAHEG